MSEGSEARIHENLTVARDGSISILRIDREEVFGALSRSMVEALGVYLRELRVSDETGVLIVTGTGRGFIAGADIGEYHGASQSEFDAYQRLSRSVFEELEALPQPTIAAVNGYAFGGGFELALCCDFIVASTKARFALPEVKLGLLPGGGGTQRLSRTVGMRLAKELIMTGRTLYPEDADKYGLLTRMSEPDNLSTTAFELAQQVLSGAPLAVRAAKRLVDDGSHQPLDVGLTTEQAVLSRLFASCDGKEGVAAFSEKREPRFEGR